MEKKKKILIIILIACLVLAAGGITTAVLLHKKSADNGTTAAAQSTTASATKKAGEVPGEEYVKEENKKDYEKDFYTFHGHFSCPECSSCTAVYCWETSYLRYEGRSGGSV
jgi:hypothetical protein